MRAGLLNEVITIFRATITKNAYGEDLEQWQEVTTTRCSVRQTNSQRTTVNDEVIYNFSKQFTVRIYVDIQPYDRIKWDNNYYTVVSIDKSRELQQITIIGDLVQ